MPSQSTPDDGDIVIRQETRDGRRVFVLHTAPGPDQVVLRIRDAAIAQAVTVAKRERVRVWLTSGGDDFRVLENFRIGVDSSPHAPQASPAKSQRG